MLKEELTIEIGDTMGTYASDKDFMLDNGNPDNFELFVLAKNEMLEALDSEKHLYLDWIFENGVTKRMAHKIVKGITYAELEATNA